MKKYVVALSLSRQRAEETTKAIAEKLGLPFEIQINHGIHGTVSYTGFVLKEEPEED